MNLVTFAALPVGTARYVLEDGPVIHYRTPERDLVGTSRRAAKVVGACSLWVAQPSPMVLSSRRYDRHDAAGADADGTMASASFRGSGSTCGSFQSMRFDALPGSGREAQEVVDLWRGIPSSAGADDVYALLRREADEQTVKRLAPGRRIVHLATHGFFLGDECGTPLEGTRAVGGLVVTHGVKPTRARSPRVQALPENPLVLRDWHSPARIVAPRPVRRKTMGS